MTNGPADLVAITSAGADVIALADHPAAILALRQASSADLRDTLRELRAAVLSTKPGAMRRSVGFWGKLTGRDIVLDAEASAMRGRSNLLLRQAETAIVELRRRQEALRAHSTRLKGAIAAMHPVIDKLLSDQTTATRGDELRTQARSARFAHLATLQAAYTITASQIDVVADSMIAVADRCAAMVPRLILLLDQQHALTGSADEAMQLSSARQALDEMDRHIDEVQDIPEAPAISKAEPT